MGLSAALAALSGSGNSLDFLMLSGVPNFDIGFRLGIAAIEEFPLGWLSLASFRAWACSVTSGLSGLPGFRDPWLPVTSRGIPLPPAGRPYDHQITLGILFHMNVQGDHLITRYHYGS